MTTADRALEEIMTRWEWQQCKAYIKTGEGEEGKALQTLSARWGIKQREIRYLLQKGDYNGLAER